MDSPIFVIQDDGRYGSAHNDGAPFDEVMNQATYAASLSRPSLGEAVPRRRFLFALAVLALLFAGLAGRAVQLQVLQGAAYRAQADRNQVQVHVVPAPRGEITDRNGLVLASNAPTFTLTVRAADLPRAGLGADAEQIAAAQADRSRVLDRASALAGLQRADIDLVLAQFADAPQDAASVRRAIPYETAMRLAVALPSLPGFGLQTSSIRSYDASASSLSHVLGYTGGISAEEYRGGRSQGYQASDDVGKAGLEKTMEPLLRGAPGKTTVEVDARGRELKLVGQQDPVPGADLALALDLPLQRFIEQDLAAELKKAGAAKGAVVAIDPRDGGIRALVSLPAYDGNQFVHGIGNDAYQALLKNPDMPLFSRAVAGEYPAGSTFKPFMAYAALKEGVINEHTSFLSTGGIRIGPWFFPDWKVGGHGITDVRKAIAWSINTFFYIVGGGFENTTGLGVERITDYARRFGFGAKTGIDLPGEADGFLPSKDWKEKAKGEAWFVGDTYHLSIGQGDLLVTPVQVAAALSVVANGGHRVTPHLVALADGKPLASAPPPDLAFDDADLQVVREGMRQAVTLGSARFLSTLSVPVAGKTGTAQPGGDDQTHAWFVGFGPYGSPNLALVVLLENGGEGSSYAVPVAKDIFAWWFAHGGS